MNRVSQAGSSRGSAFPSSRIAATVAVAGLAFRFERTVFAVILLPVILLTIGTVYGGFHYGVDALAGLMVGLFFARYGPGLVLRADGRSSYPTR